MDFNTSFSIILHAMLDKTTIHKCFFRKSREVYNVKLSGPDVLSNEKESITSCEILNSLVSLSARLKCYKHC